MLTNPQVVNKELLSKICGDDLTITIWMVPHHGQGYIKQYLYMIENDGTNGMDATITGLAFAQSMPYTFAFSDSHELDLDKPNTESIADVPTFELLINMLRNFNLAFINIPKPSVSLGGSGYGVRIEWRHTITVSWYGHENDTDKETYSLWKTIDTRITNP